MNRKKQFIKTVLCLLLSAGLVCSDMPSAAFAANGAPETERMTEMQKTEQTQEIQSEYNTDMETAESGSGETAASQDGEKETESAEVTGAEAEETKTEEAEPEKTEPAPPEETSSTEIYTEETTQAPSPEQMSETGTESVEETETETETVSEMASETVSEIETEAEESVEKLVFSDSVLDQGEYKEDGNDITWVIDTDNKLTVTGTGNCVKPRSIDFLGVKYESCWAGSRYPIKSAEINVKGMTNASGMFLNHSKLTSVDLSGSDTANVTDMSGMFWGCGKLESVKGLDTSKVTNMYAMFNSCSSLTSIDVSGFDTSKVTNMNGMFYNCNSLTSIDISGFDTGNVTKMASMFAECQSLTSIDVSGLDTGNVTDMNHMFADCRSLTSIDVSGFDTRNVTNMESMFETCVKLTNINVGSIDTRNVTSMYRMFYSCNSLTSIDVSGFKTGNVTNMSNMFYQCSSLTGVDVSGFETGNVTDMGVMFSGCLSLTSIDVSDFDTGNVTDMSAMFSKCSKLTKIDVSGFKTGNVTSMGSMFSGCSELTEIDVSGFDTGNVTSMGGMFSGCSKLTGIDVSGFDTGNVTEMYEMFSGCSKLTKIDVSGFKTGNVTSMGGMFSGCSKLTEIDVSGFDTGNVTDMYEMFSGCSSLPKLDLNNFDTGKVTAIREMFKGCSRLTSLDLSSFDAGNLSQDTYHYEGVLSGCSSLTQLYTPRNLKKDIALEGTWYDMDGSSYTALPKEQTDSVLLYRKISSSEGAGRLTAKKETTAYFCGDTLNTQDLTVIYYNASGEAKKLTQAEYSTNEADININTAGLQTLTVTYQPSEGVSLTADILLTVKKKFDDTCVTVTLPGADSYSYVYDGSRKNPSPVVTYTEDDGTTITLKKKTDYTVSYKNNINPYKDGADAAENAPTVTVTGRGTYGGQVAKTFEIRKATAPENEELTHEVTSFSSPQTINIPIKDSFQGYKKVSCTVGTPVENDEISGSVLAGTPTMNSSMNQLICSLNAGTAGDFVTIPVTVSFDNYEDAVLNVKIIFTGTPAAEKKKVTISGIEIKNSVYNKTPVSYTGTAKAVSETDNIDLTGTVKLTYTYSGTQADGVAYAATQSAPVNAGSYKLTVAVAQDDKNYTGSAEYPFTIAKAPLIITARDRGLKIGAELPKAEDYQFDIAGLLEGDTLITNPTLSCSIADTAAAGEYDITVSGADAGMNYDITYKNGTLTVSETGETAKYYTVIFTLSGRGSDITNTGVKEGSLLEQPLEPQAEGYIFTGWYKDQACTVRWDFATDTVQADTVIYAGWKKKDADNEEDASWHISEIAPMVYTGNAIKPAVMVYDSDGTLMKAGTHYTIAYKNNTDADKVAAAGGTRSTESGSTDGFHEALPHVIITGKGNYTGSIYKNFHIYPASISDDGETPAKGFTLKCTEQFVTASKEQKPFASIKYKKAMTIGKDYDIVFSKYAVDGSLQEITSGSAIPAISANDAGTFKLAITGKGNFSGAIEKDIYVGSKDSLMKNAKITVGKDIKSVQYTGADIEPKASGENGTNVFTVKLGNKFLTPETDYTVSYRNNRAAGTAAIIVKGKGQYIGTKTAAFTIKGTPFKAKDAAIKNFEVSRIYTGSAIEQGRDGVTIGGKTLNYGTDYTVAYKNNVKKGTATVTFVANPESGFSGSFNKTFKIVAADLAQTSTDITFTDYTVTGSGAGRKLSGSTSYSKAGAKPSGSFVLRYNNGNILRQGTDYTVSYTNNKKADTDAAMTIKGKGNYTGQITISYTVSKAALDKNANLTQSCTPVRYNEGKPDDYLYQPKFKVLDGNKALAAKSDYKAITDTSYINCTQDKVTAYLAALESGTVTGDVLEAMRPCVEITAADNGGYTGSRKVYLTVYKTKLTNRNIKVEITDKTDIYTGTQVRPQVTVRYNGSNGIIDLVEGRDYTLTYGANITAGKNKGSVTVNGTGLYGGSVTTKFTIQSKDVNKK